MFKAIFYVSFPGIFSQVGNFIYNQKHDLHIWEDKVFTDAHEFNTAAETALKGDGFIVKPLPRVWLDGGDTAEKTLKAGRDKDSMTELRLTRPDLYNHAPEHHEHSKEAQAFVEKDAHVGNIEATKEAFAESTSKKLETVTDTRQPSHVRISEPEPAPPVKPKAGRPKKAAPTESD